MLSPTATLDASVRLYRFSTRSMLLCVSDCKVGKGSTPATPGLCEVIDGSMVVSCIAGRCYATYAPCDAV